VGTEDTCSSLFSQNPHLGKSKAGKFALSMGLVNLPAGFFGAVPMRHGTGGLAAHYRFGARSGGAPVMIGHFLKQKSDLDLAPIDPTPPPHQRIQTLLSDPEFKRFLVNRFAVDPAFVRRKFYECAEACGFAKRIGGPEMIRRARAVELIHGNIPLPAVQRLLGLSSQKSPTRKRNSSG
jgi:Molybdate transporter of MFS superfamily